MHTESPRVLMFAPFCYPPASAEAIVTAKLLLAALDAGWEIDVISQTNAGQFYPYNANGIWKPLNKIVKNIDGFKGFEALKKLSPPTLETVFSKIESLVWVIKAVYAARRLSSKKKYDIILSRVAPQYGHLPALILSQLLDVPWVANWSDPMPPQKSPYPYGNGPNAKILTFLQKYFELVAKKADWHTFPSERLRTYISSYLAKCVDKSSVIPHVALERLRCKCLAAQKEFMLCHIGGLGLRKPDVFLEGVSKFLKSTRIDSPFFVKFVSLLFDNVKEIARNLGIEDRIIFEKAKTYEETQRIAETSTILVVIEASCEEGIFFPSKFVDFVQTGRPILAVSPAVGTLNDILTTHGGGVAVNGNSPDDVARAIQILYTSWRDGTLDEKYGSDRLIHLFSEKKIMDQYMEIFGHLKI